MDKNPTERDLIIRAIAAARAHGVGLTLAAVEPRTGEERADAAIDLQVGDRTTRYLVAVKKGLRPATLGAALLRLQELAEKGGPVMLVADYLTPQFPCGRHHHHGRLRAGCPAFNCGDRR